MYDTATQRVWHWLAVVYFEAVRPDPRRRTKGHERIFFVVLGGSSWNVTNVLAVGRARGFAHNQAIGQDILVDIAIDAGEPTKQVQRGAASHLAQWLAHSRERGEGLSCKILVVEAH